MIAAASPLPSSLPSDPANAREKRPQRRAAASQGIQSVQSTHLAPRASAHGHPEVTLARATRHEEAVRMAPRSTHGQVHVRERVSTMHPARGYERASWARSDRGKIKQGQRSLAAQGIPKPADQRVTRYDLRQPQAAA